MPRSCVHLRCPACDSAFAFLLAVSRVSGPGPRGFAAKFRTSSAAEPTKTLVLLLVPGSSGLQQ